MIRTLLATTALAALLATGAIAQDAAPADPNAPATTETAPADNSTMAPADNSTMAPADNSTMAPADNSTMAPADTTTDMAFDMATGYTIADTDGIASKIIGAGVWSSAADGAENIGTVKDLVISANGGVEAAVLAVGGFLGIGEKNVAVEWSELSWETNQNGDEVIVLPTTAEALTNAPDFIWPEDEVAAPGAATEPANDSVTDPNAMAPAEPAPAQ